MLSYTWSTPCHWWRLFSQSTRCSKLAWTCTGPSWTCWRIARPWWRLVWTCWRLAWTCGRLLDFLEVSSALAKSLPSTSSSVSSVIFKLSGCHISRRRACFHPCSAPCSPHTSPPSPCSFWEWPHPHSSSGYVQVTFPEGNLIFDRGKKHCCAQLKFQSSIRGGWKGDLARRSAGGGGEERPTWRCEQWIL